MEVFQDYAYYYNAFYRDKNYQTEAGQVDFLLRKYQVKSIHSILNFGCGTGRHDMALSSMGYACTGIDMSAEMIKIAQDNAGTGRHDITFEVADIRAYEPKKKYDAVVSLFHVISYQNSNEDVLAAFRSARKALDRNGIFLFDAWYGPGVLSDRPALRIKEAETDQYRLVRIARPVMHEKTNVVDVCYEVFLIDRLTGVTKTINEVHNMRYFFRPEMEFYLKEAGFELLDNPDCRSLGETNFESWTCYFAAKAV